MITLGLTGSIGMGKSAVSAMFRRAGVPVFDADAAVHELQGPGGALVAAIETRFPGSTSAKGVDRQKLGSMVLGNAAELLALERIVHPGVARLRAKWLRRHRSRRIVALDIPLLFEKKGWKSVDVIVVVSAPHWVQRRRVLKRKGMSAAKLRHIRRLQLPDHQKRRRAHFVIETGRLKHQTERQVRGLVACLRAQRGR